ncbi:hypothetical protein [Micromonospora noduli]|uniref:hypothetical protein n=1 Tax=Micromonospora noduli TaxID=709876 RepID=UPI0015EB3E50|nr:hypothetical protein [Micromonospora noduli]
MPTGPLDLDGDTPTPAATDASPGKQVELATLSVGVSTGPDPYLTLAFAGVDLWSPGIDSGWVLFELVDAALDGAP